MSATAAPPSSGTQQPNAGSRKERESQDPVTITFSDGNTASTVLKDWASLEDRLGGCALACSSVWTTTWLDHYGDLVPYRFAIGRKDGRVCGICLLTEGVDQREGPFPIKTLHLGTAGEPETESICVEYNAILAEEGCRDEFLFALMQELQRDARWDELRLDGFDAQESESLGLRDWGFEAAERESLYFDFARNRTGSSDVMAHLGKSTKKQLHRCLNAYRGLVTEWSESVDSAESIFEDLVRLHQARWTAVGQPGAYSSQRFRGFHLDLIRKLVPHQQAALFRVSHEGTVIGCLHLLIDRNRVLSYQCGWSSPTGSLSPGLLTEYLCLEESLRRGFLAYDMLAGPTRHKSSLSTDCSRLLWYRKRRPRLKYRVLDIARSIKRRWRRASETPSV